jgi:hypothetical protein
MRLANLVILLLFATIALALLAVLVSHSRSPIELQVVTIEPSGMVDDAGRVPPLITVRAINRSVGDALIQGTEGGWIAVEAKVNNDWVKTENACSFGGLIVPAGRSYLEENKCMLVVPAGSEACRVRLKYTLCPVRWRFWLALGDSTKRIVRKLPILDKWLERDAEVQYQNWMKGKLRPHWREVTPELRLPSSV